MEDWNQEYTQWQNHSDMPEPKKRRPGFGNGVLVGVLSTLAVVVLLGGITAAAFLATGKSFGSGSNQPGGKIPGIWGQQDSDDGDADVSDENVLNADLLSQISTIEAYLNQAYLHEVDIEKVRTGILKGMMAALGDPYSEYYDEAELSSFNDTTQGEYVGIGAVVSQEKATGIVRISKPYEGTPSAEAGLLPGDIIVSVDGTEVTGMDLSRVVSLIKGEEGSNVMLHIYREGEEKEMDIAVTRKTVILPTVTGKMLDDHIGYIVITGFEGVTAEQFKTTYEELKGQGMERVIFDLRDNGGGLVDTVEKMVDYLLPEGTVFYVKYKDGTKDMEYESDASAALDIPAVVLVNGNTASAAEIFSGNIQAFGKGKVVGTTTYGKGVMQSLYYTNQERTTGIKLTVADYYINSDININGTGVIPDVEIELDEAVSKLLVIPMEQDNQLQKAIEVVKGQ